MDEKGAAIVKQTADFAVGREERERREWGVAGRIGVMVFGGRGLMPRLFPLRFHSGDTGIERIFGVLAAPEP